MSGVRVVKSCFVLIFLVGLLPLWSTGSYAEDASVLPKGTFQIMADSHIYFTTNERYSTGGDKEDIATNFNILLNAANLGSIVSAFEAGFALPPGSANFGKTNTSFGWSFFRTTWQIAYGVTDRFTFGIRIPWVRMKNNVSFSNDTSGANAGFNPAAVSGANPLGLFPCATTGCTGGADVAAGTTPLTTAQAQASLGVLGFNPLQDFQDEGFEDLSIGGRYQYYRDEDWRLAFTGAFRIPSRKLRNPANLAAIDFGWGAHALVFQFTQDYVSQPDGILKDLGIPTPGSYAINTALSVDHFFPMKRSARVTSFDNPLGGVFDNVRQQLGNIVNVSISPRIGVLIPGLVLGGSYNFEHKGKDHNDCGGGVPSCGDLAIASDYISHIYIVSLSYTTLPLVIEKNFPLPLVMRVSYRDRFAGENLLWVAKYIGIALEAYF